MEEMRPSLGAGSATTAGVIKVVALLAVVGVLSLAPVVVGSAQSADNLLSNGDFEATPLGRDWGFQKTGGSFGEYDTTTSHSDKISAKITKVNDGTSTTVAVVQYVNVEPNTEYTLSAYARSKMENGWALLFAYQLKKDGGWIGTTRDVGAPKGEKFEPIEVTFTTSPDAGILVVRFEIFGNETVGEAWVDDVCLRKKEPSTVPLTLQAESAQMGQDSRVALTNELVSMEFLRKGNTFALASFVDKAASYDYVAGPASLWRITMEDQQGKSTVIDERSGEVSYRYDREAEAGETLHLVWDGLDVPGERDAVQVDVSVTLGAASPLSFWGLKIVSKSTRWGVSSITFPTLTLKGTIGAESDDDCFVYPQDTGRLIRDPRHNLKGSIYGYYPQWEVSLQMYAFYDRKTGLYFATYDGEGHHKDFHFYMSGDNFLWSITYPVEDQGKPREGYIQPYPVALGVFKGDWLDAAKIYRSWAKGQEWCSKGPLWVRDDVSRKLKETALTVLRGPIMSPAKESIPPLAGVRGDMSATKLREALESIQPQPTATYLGKIKEYYGVPIGTWHAEWHVDGWDHSGYPRFVPLAGFDEAMSLIHKEGGIYYQPRVNIFRYGFGREVWNNESEDAATKGRDGKVTRSGLGSYSTAIMCPYTEFWQGFWEKKILELQSYGIDGCYLDELGSIRTPPCFDPSHGHPLGGGSYGIQGMRKLLTRMRNAVRSKDPGFYLTGEAMQEAYLDLVDGNLVPGGFFPDRIPLWQAVYHDYAITYSIDLGKFGDAYAAQFYPDPSGYSNLDELVSRAGLQFVWGVKLGAVRDDLMFYSEEGASYVRHLARTYARAQKFLLYGEMVRFPSLISHPPEITVEWPSSGKLGRVFLPAVLASAWKSPDGSLGLVFYNISPEEQSLSYAFSLDEYGIAADQCRVRSLTEDGEVELGVFPAKDIKREDVILPRTALVLEFWPIPAHK